MKVPPNWFTFLPEHIQNLYTKQQLTERPTIEGVQYLDMQSGNSLWPSIGQERSYNALPIDLLKKVKVEAARINTLDAAQVFIGAETANIWRLLLQVCTTTNDTILSVGPMPQDLLHIAKVQGTLQHEISAVLDADDRPEQYCHPSPKIIYIANPNLLTGIGPDRWALIDFIADFEGIVVIDESAIDFCLEQSMLEWLQQFEHLVVLRGFSKAWGLAGIQTGIAFAHPTMIDLLNFIQGTCPVGQDSLQAVLNALYVPANKDRAVQKIKQERTILLKAIHELPFVLRTWPSDSDRLLLEVEDAKNIANILQSECILVQSNFTHTTYKNCIQITIGKPLDNQRLIAVLKTVQTRNARSTQFLKTVSTSLRKASVYLGMLKKILST